jgi:hypothetical protein
MLHSASSAQILAGSTLEQVTGTTSATAPPIFKTGFLGIGHESADAAVTTLPAASVGADESSSLLFDDRIDTNATLSYDFTVAGAASIMVPVVITGFINTTATGFLGTSATADASIRVDDQTTSTLLYHATGCAGNETCSGLCLPDTSCPGLVGYSDTVLVGLGDDVLVVLSADAEVFPSLFGESATAMIDPSIFIDPTFPEADLFTILVAPGIGNPPPSSLENAVPEPSSLALLMCALAAWCLVNSVRGAGRTPLNTTHLRVRAISRALGSFYHA